MTSLHKSVAVALAIVALCAVLLAQGGASGAISGAVRDANGGSLADAKVKVISRATGKAASK